MDKVIKNIQISNLFNRYTFNWDLNPDVNILVGINGSGKSTVLRDINYYYNDKKRLKDEGYNIKIMPDISESLKCLLIDTFDIAIIGHKTKDICDSILDIKLRDLLYETGKENKLSFVNYRLKATNSAKSAELVNRKIESLFSLIDNLFSKTKKKIEIDIRDNSIIFKNEKDIIRLSNLSSGEKQLLIILFTVFLTEEQPFLLLMDEPEISLHIEWQQHLIDTIRQLNPNCQLVIATHSPSIFGEGWGDKIFFMEDLTRNDE